VQKQCTLFCLDEMAKCELYLNNRTLYKLKKKLCRGQCGLVAAIGAGHAKQIYTFKDFRKDFLLFDKNAGFG